VALVPLEFLQPDEPTVHFAARCKACRVEVESTLVPLVEEANEGHYSVWRRQRRQEFQVWCYGDRHRLARVSIPVKFLVAGSPAVRFEARCVGCKEYTETEFTTAVSTEQAPAASSYPRRPASLRHV
jgi:hypothetical protein